MVEEHWYLVYAMVMAFQLPKRSGSSTGCVSRHQNSFAMQHYPEGRSGAERTCGKKQQSFFYKGTVTDYFRVELMGKVLLLHRFLRKLLWEVFCFVMIH